MSAPQFVPRPAAERPRVYESPARRPASWTNDRPGDFNEPQPAGPRLGFQGPDQGYVLRLARSFAGRLVLTTGEHPDDALAGCAAVALKRASLFGRAPVVHDLTVALSVWGYLAPADPELVSLRASLFEEVRHPHHYMALRKIADLVPAAVLARPVGDVEQQARHDWRQFFGRVDGAVPVGAAPVAEAAPVMSAPVAAPSPQVQAPPPVPLPASPPPPPPPPPPPITRPPDLPAPAVAPVPDAPAPEEHRVGEPLTPRPPETPEPAVPELGASAPAEAEPVEAEQVEAEQAAAEQADARPALRDEAETTEGLPVDQSDLPPEQRKPVPRRPVSTEDITHLVAEAKRALRHRPQH